jgi:hypothetical protein
MLNRDKDLESLSEGIPNMPRSLTARERLADHLYFYLQTASWFVFLAGGIAGYAIKGLIGCVALLAGGWLFGMWMRRSLGQRGRNQFLGFYQRIRERANGSRRGLLEWLIEAIRGSGFTISKCRAITAAYDRAMLQGRSTSSAAEQQAILQRLDAEVKRISYSS